MRYGDDGKYVYAHLFTYKYDSKGNWYGRLDTYTQIDNDGRKPTSEPWMMMYRVITYFELGTAVSHFPNRLRHT